MEKTTVPYAFTDRLRYLLRPKRKNSIGNSISFFYPNCMYRTVPWYPPKPVVFFSVRHGADWAGVDRADSGAGERGGRAGGAPTGPFCGAHPARHRPSHRHDRHQARPLQPLQS